MSVCLFNICLLTRVYAPPGRVLTWFSAACSEQASDQGLTNKQVNELAGIMIVLNQFPPKGQQDEDLGASGLLRREFQEKPAGKWETGTGKGQKLAKCGFSHALPLRATGALPGEHWGQSRKATWLSILPTPIPGEVFSLSPPVHISY